MNFDLAMKWGWDGDWLEGWELVEGMGTGLRCLLLGLGLERKGVSGVSNFRSHVECTVRSEYVSGVYTITQLFYLLLKLSVA